MTPRIVLTGIVALVSLVNFAVAQNQRDLAVRRDKLELSSDATWIYDDFEAARKAAAETKRPLMVVFR